jgi:hypothetical protein
MGLLDTWQHEHAQSKVETTRATAVSGPATQTVHGISYHEDVSKEEGRLQHAVHLAAVDVVEDRVGVHEHARRAAMKMNARDKTQELNTRVRHASRARVGGSRAQRASEGTKGKQNQRLDTRDFREKEISE